MYTYGLDIIVIIWSWYEEIYGINNLGSPMLLCVLKSNERFKKSENYILFLTIAYFLSYLTMLLYSFMIAFGADLIKSQWILSPNRMIGKSSRNRNISVHLFCQQKFVLFTISIYSFACTHLVRVPRASFSHYIITATRLPTVFFFH